MTDLELLRRWADDRCARSFGLVVRRHVGWVYSASLRQVAGDAHLAEDITQAVFILLSRRAASITPQTLLTGWLFNTLRFAAMEARRKEARRRRHEARAAVEQDAAGPADAADAPWERLSPLLDEAIASLRESDRQAVLLRFFEKRSFEELAVALGTTEVTARKRVSRAVRKLRAYFARKGAIASAVLVVLALAHSSRAAPAELAQSVAAAGAAQGPSSAAALELARAVTGLIHAARRRLAAAILAGAALVVGGLSGVALSPLYESLDRARPGHAWDEDDWGDAPPLLAADTIWADADLEPDSPGPPSRGTWRAARDGSAGDKGTPAPTRPLLAPPAPRRAPQRRPALHIDPLQRFLDDAPTGDPDPRPARGPGDAAAPSHPAPAAADEDLAYGTETPYPDYGRAPTGAPAGADPGADPKRAGDLGGGAGGGGGTPGATGGLPGAGAARPPILSPDEAASLVRTVAAPAPWSRTLSGAAAGSTGAWVAGRPVGSDDEFLRATDPAGPSFAAGRALGGANPGIGKAGGPPLPTRPAAPDPGDARDRAVRYILYRRGPDGRLRLLDPDADPRSFENRLVPVGSTAKPARGGAPAPPATGTPDSATAVGGALTPAGSGYTGTGGWVYRAGATTFSRVTAARASLDGAAPDRHPDHEDVVYVILDPAAPWATPWADPWADGSVLSGTASASADGFLSPGLPGPPGGAAVWVLPGGAGADGRAHILGGLPDADGALIGPTLPAGPLAPGVPFAPGDPFAPADAPLPGVPEPAGAALAALGLGAALMRRRRRPIDR